MPLLGLVFGEAEKISANAGRVNEAAAFDIASLAPAAVDMRDDLRAEGHVDRTADIPVIRGGCKAADRVNMNMVGGYFARNAAVKQVDRAPDCLTAEEQYGGAAQDFDALHGQRVDRHRVVRRGIRSVDRPDAVGQDL